MKRKCLAGTRRAGTATALVAFAWGLLGAGPAAPDPTAGPALIGPICADVVGAGENVAGASAPPVASLCTGV